MSKERLKSLTLSAEATAIEAVTTHGDEIAMRILEDLIATREQVQKDLERTRFLVEQEEQGGGEPVSQ